MIVAIDGPQSSGKTTCLDALREHPLVGYRVNFVEEVAREVAPRFGVNQAQDWERLLGDKERLAAFFDDEYDALHAAEIEPAVVDGSSLLVTAYKRTFLDPRATPKYPPNYDLLFLCEPWETPQHDGFRFLTGQLRVLAEYRNLLSELDLTDRVVELPATRSRLDFLRSHPIWSEMRHSQ